MSQKRHIYIAGTGRAGTTFLVCYFTALGLDTTLSRNRNAKFHHRANAGFEVSPHDLNSADLPYVVKTPWLYCVIDDLIASGAFRPDAVIIPVRKLEDAAASRLAVQQKSIPIEARHWQDWGAAAGGAIYSMRSVDQERILAVGFHTLVERLVNVDAPIVFLHYPRLIEDSDYLFARIRQLVPNVSDSEAREAHSLSVRHAPQPSPVEPGQPPTYIQASQRV